MNEVAASRLFSGQLQLKMHVAQKATSAASGKSRGARSVAKPAGQPAAAAAATPAAQPPGRRGSEEDPIDVYDSDDDAGEDAVQRAALISEALRQLNIVLRERWKLGRVPINTKLQSNVCAATPAAPVLAA